jgi:hypothetical protein
VHIFVLHKICSPLSLSFSSFISSSQFSIYRCGINQPFTYSFHPSVFFYCCISVQYTLHLLSCTYTTSPMRVYTRTTHPTWEILIINNKQINKINGARFLHSTHHVQNCVHVTNSCTSSQWSQLLSLVSTKNMFTDEMHPPSGAHVHRIYTCISRLYFDKLLCSFPRRRSYVRVCCCLTYKIYDVPHIRISSPYFFFFWYFLYHLCYILYVAHIFYSLFSVQYYCYIVTLLLSVLYDLPYCTLITASLSVCCGRVVCLPYIHIFPLRRSI